MPQVHIQRPSDTLENLKLSKGKLESIIVVGQDQNESIRVYMDGNMQVKSVYVSQSVSLENIQVAIQEAIQNTIDAVKTVRKAEIRGRLSIESVRAKTWEIIEEVI
jgi:DNA-binding protein YbaB